MSVTISEHDEEILLLAAEYGIAGAAQRENRSPQTVKNWLHMIYAELGARNMAHAVMILLLNKP